MEYTEQSGVDFVLDAAGDNSLIIESGMIAKSGTICSYAGRTGFKDCLYEVIFKACNICAVDGQPIHK